MLATHGYENRRIKIRKRNRRFAPTFQNATKCNAVQQEDRRSPARPLSAGITEQTQSYPPAFKGAPCAAHRSPGTELEGSHHECYKMQHQNRISPAGPLSALLITERNTHGRRCWPPHGYEKI